jgi:hypothetical protein
MSVSVMCCKRGVNGNNPLEIKTMVVTISTFETRLPIEPKGVHGKRAVAEPDRLLSAAELAARVYAYYDCEPEAPLVMPKKVA